MRNSLDGMLVLQITSADCAGLLNSLNRSKMILTDVTMLDALTLQITVPRKTYKAVMAIAEKQGASVKALKRTGAYWFGASILRRPVLLAFSCLALFLTVFLSGRVMFVSVEGNHEIPDSQIIEAAERCGIRFGTSRRQVRSEKMKNALLQEIPQLQWAGINTLGCTAVISVKEKTAPAEETEIENGVCSIVAARDGIIQSCTVFKGNPLCATGQAVKAGQTLVSGYTDLGIVTQATSADAEIKALTFRQLEVFSPDASVTRGAVANTKKVYSLRIGKKLIKLSKDSGIIGTTCAKIYTEEYVFLPGGFRLPVCLITESLYFYEPSQDASAETDSIDWLAEFAADYLHGEMIAGEVISAQTEIAEENGICHLNGRYACIELIGQRKYEDMIPKDGEHD